MRRELSQKTGEIMATLKRPKWYLDGVKPLQNHPWTDREKLAVFAFRDEVDTPAEVVARAFGVSKTQIYNITRLVRRSKNKECFSCGHSLTRKELRQKTLIKSCDRCKEEKRKYKQKRREKCLANGICPYCEKRKLVKGKKACTKCLSASHRRRYNQGVCGQCGQRPIAKDSEALCPLCLEVNRKRSAAQRKIKKAIKGGKLCATGKNSKK